jgi:hypothetical protein
LYRGLAEQRVSQLHQQEASVVSAQTTLKVSQRQIEALAEVHTKPVKLVAPTMIEVAKGNSRLETPEH